MSAIAKRLSVALFMLVVIGVAMVTSSQYRNDLARAYARLEHASLVVETPCGPIEYAVAGSGPPVLLVHGAGGGFDQGLQFGQPLIEAGFTVLAPSRFGYLRTPAPRDVSPTAQAEAHVCLLDALHIEQVAAFGGSAGAPSVVQLCLRHPQRCSSMTLAVPAISLPPAEEIRPSWLAGLVIRASLRSEFLFWLATRLARETVVESVLATPAMDVRRASPAERARVQNVLTRIAPIRPRAAGLMIDATVTTAPANYAFESVSVPTLLVSTRNDGFHTLAAAEQAAARIPRAKLVVFEDGGHLWVGHESQLWSTVQAFLHAEAEVTADPDT
jgi:2-hydroxy-6-oxonona-2,4-dienedioate hydrolase